MKAIYRKELESYFCTSSGYIFISVFLLLSGLFFTIGNIVGRSGDLLFLLRNMSYLCMLLCPLLTMRLVAGERQQKTNILLLSSPVTQVQIIAGKFLAACSVFFLALAGTFVFPLVVSMYGRLYMAETLVGYLGFAMVGCCFIAMDLMISCFFNSQPAAAVSSLGINLVVWLFDVIAMTSTGIVGRVCAFLSLYQRFTPYTMGQLSYANILFCVVFCLIMLISAIFVLDKRKWRDAL